VAAVHAFEYGAQAAAIHGGLVARRAGLPPIAAWLGALHDARLAVDHLDPIDEPLAIGAALLLRDGGNAIYRCRVVANGRTLADGRITIMGRTMAVR
jgi:predicted hotdog family 3-hydroxylacyl-ACP dehydratase